MQAIRNLRFEYLWLVIALVAMPAPAQNVRVYVTNSAGDSVHVIDPATRKVVQVLEGRGERAWDHVLP
jgi:hypothetical protein